MPPPLVRVPFRARFFSPSSWRLIRSVDGAKRTMKQRLALLEPYLSDQAYEVFLKHSTGDAIQTRAMQKQSPPQQIRFEDWLAPSSQNRNTYPKVSMVNIVKAPAPMGWLRTWIKASGLMAVPWLISGIAAILATMILDPMLLLAWFRQCQSKLADFLTRRRDDRRLSLKQSQDREGQPWST